MRAINADALKEVIYESWGGDPKYHTAINVDFKTETEIKAEYACLMLETIDAQPTIEPKRGRWVNDNCSICGQYVFRGDIRSYCPNCGAKMDEVEE